MSHNRKSVTEDTECSSLQPSTSQETQDRQNSTATESDEVLMDSEEEDEISSYESDEYYANAISESECKEDNTNSEILASPFISTTLSSSSYCTDQIPIIKTFTWDTHKPNLKNIPFHSDSGIKISPLGDLPIDYYFLIANEDLFNLIITETNRQTKYLSNSNNFPRSRIKSLKPLTRQDLEVFLGLIYLTGHIKAPSLGHFWRKDDLYHFPVFANAMSRDKFHNILCSLHFSKNHEQGDPITTDPLNKIQPLLDIFHNNMKNIYYPNKELNLSEFKFLRQKHNGFHFSLHTKNKKIKDSLQFYMVSEPSGLVLRNLICFGLPDVGGSNHEENIVKYLLDDYLEAGHSVYFDNLYLSVSIATDLIDKKTYSTGKLVSDSKECPEVTGTKLKKVDAHYTPKGVCVLKCNEKDDILISSEFSTDLVKYKAKSGNDSKKPEVIFKYDKFMSEVHRADKVLAYYPWEHEKLKWYAKVGIYIFHIIMNNSYLLYKQKHGNMPVLSFRDSVIEALIYRNRSRIQKPVQQTTFNVHLPIKSTKNDERGKKRKRCRVCSSNGIRKDVLTFCPDCPDKPGLCSGQCFKDYHKYY